jgi:hypothetical protein
MPTTVSARAGQFAWPALTLSLIFARKRAGWFTSAAKRPYWMFAIVLRLSRAHFR